MIILWNFIDNCRLFEATSASLVVCELAQYLDKFVGKGKEGNNDGLEASRL